MHLRIARIVTYLSVTAGIGLYVVALANRLDRLDRSIVEIVLLNCMPYVICLVLDRVVKHPVAVSCASLLLLAVDLWLFKDIVEVPSFTMPVFLYSVIVSRYSPLLKLLFVLPAGWLAGLMIEKVCQGAEADHPHGK